MKSFFQRRKHQKLNELSDEALELTQRQSDVSSSSDSFVSFDPTSFTREEFSSSPVVEINGYMKSDFPSKFPREPVNSRRCWSLTWPSKKHRHQLSSLREVSVSGEACFESENLRQELVDLNTLELQLRSQSKMNVGDNPFVRSDDMKSARRRTKDYDKVASADRAKHLLREATWRRRVSSLEAFFQKETTSRTIKYKDQALESDIKKVVSFDKRGDVLSPMSLTGNDGLHSSSFRSSMKMNARRKSKSFGETFEQGVSGVLGEITSKGEEILDSVPDWSVGSSSVDHYMSATSDDEDTSFSGFPSRQHFSWNGVDRSISSGDDDDDEDYISQAGCNSVQSCELFSSEIGSFLQEILPRDPSDVGCLSAISSSSTGTSTRSKRQRRK